MTKCSLALPSKLSLRCLAEQRVLLVEARALCEDAAMQGQLIPRIVFTCLRHSPLVQSCFRNEKDSRADPKLSVRRGV